MWLRWCLWLTLHQLGAADVGVAQQTWLDLEELARGKPSEKVSSWSHWQQRLTALHELHPDPEASAVLSWLYLFGLPAESHSSRWRTTSPALVERNIDQAIATARDALGQQCGRCYALLGFILASGFPPLVGAAHLSPSRLVFLGPVAAANGAGAARRPRDVGRPDSAAAAYAAAAELGDALGILGASFLTAKRMMNEDLKAPMANQASSMISRKPFLSPLSGSSASGSAACTLGSSLGLLASEVVEQQSSWGPPPPPLTAQRRSNAADTAFAEHVLADVSNAPAADLTKVAQLLEGHHVEVSALPELCRRHADAEALYAAAAQRGETRAALRTAVERLQRNDSQGAKPFLEQVSQGADEPLVAMAQYYLTRFTNETNSTEDERRELAWPHLVRAADLGRQDAELLVAHAHLNPPAAAESSPLVPNRSEAARRYRRLVNHSAVPQATPGVALERRRLGNLSEVQAFAAYNLGVLSLSDGEDDAKSCEAQQLFHDVALSQGFLVRLTLALERRAAHLGDLHGALLLAMLLSDLGHELGHLDAAHLWDTWATGSRPTHLVTPAEEGHGASEAVPCDLHGWWTTNSTELLMQNVSRLFASKVSGGGFEMFNASHDGFQGVEMAGSVLPQPESSEFQHLHSFLWHTTYDAFPAAAPVPVALQPPGAVPHLVEFHHQRGKLTMDKSCRIAAVEGMYVNWTFQRLDDSTAAEEEPEEKDTTDTVIIRAEDGDDSEVIPTRDWLHCWVRPERYYVALKAVLSEQPEERPAAEPGTWEEVMALTSSKDCPCYGAFACRRGDGACEVLAKLSAGAGEELSACQPGSSLCREVPPEIDPPHSNWAAPPEVCAFYFYRRAATDGNIDAMHVLSHAYSNGIRGAPKDPAEAFGWSLRAMQLGDLRGSFDVAYSMDFALGTAADPARAMEIYREILAAQGLDPESLLGKFGASFLSWANSGRYMASRLLQGEE